MDQALDTLFQFDENTVVGDRYHSAGGLLADRIAGDHRLPRVLAQLFDAQRYPVVLLVIFQNLDLELLADLVQLRRMRDRAPRTGR